MRQIWKRLSGTRAPSPLPHTADALPINCPIGLLRTPTAGRRLGEYNLTTLVTGAAGLIGMHVASALLGRGEPVVGIDNFPPYYLLVLKRARVAHLQARYGDVFHFLDVDFGDAHPLAAPLPRHHLARPLPSR